MPAKRRLPKNRDHPVTPEAVEAFSARDRAALHRELKLRPWMQSPLCAVGDCPWSPGSAGAATWPLVVALREELEAANAG